MDKKTYEALKEVMVFATNATSPTEADRHAAAFQSVWGWMDEVAKDYEGSDATE